MRHANSSSGPDPERRVKENHSEPSSLSNHSKQLMNQVDYVMAAHEMGGRPYFYVDKDE